MIPSVEFVSPYWYDYVHKHNDLAVRKYIKKKKLTYPTRDKINKYTKQIEKIWKVEGKKLLLELSKISGIEWKETNIKCYIIGMGYAVSDPLTISIKKDVNVFIDVLTHELIHRIEVQNYKKWMKWSRYILKKYRKENIETQNHILVHAIHTSIFCKLFDEGRLKKMIKRHNSLKNYLRAWEIVEKEGYENIIKQFRKVTS